MQRLRGIDSMFVSLESPTNLLHVGAVAVLDPSTAPSGAPAPHEALRRVVESRLDRLEPFRRRLATVPAGLDHPRWVDEMPDLDRHIRRGALPAPGGEAELGAYTADVLSRPLDRRRPLWEVHVVEGLEGDLVAGVAKIHHSAVDGIAGAEVTGHLMDLAPQLPDGQARPELPKQSGNGAPSPLWLLRDAVINNARRAIPAARILAGLPMATARAFSGDAGAEMMAPLVPFRGPRTSLAARVGTQRAVGLAQVEREDIEHVREATGATVNDVILALTGAVLRRYLEERGELPDEPLVGFVPVSVRRAGETGTSGVNRLSGMLVSLGTDIADPVIRVLQVSESARTAKAQTQHVGPDIFSQLFELAVPAVLTPAGWVARATGLVARRPPFNAVVSTFPGPPVPLYCGGAELLAYYPFGPVIDGAAVNVTTMSYKDQIGFGVLTCRDAIPGADALARAIPEEMRELTKAVNSCQRRRNGAAGKAARKKPDVVPGERTETTPAPPAQDQPSGPPAAPAQPPSPRAVTTVLLRTRLEFVADQAGNA